MTSASNNYFAVLSCSQGLAHKWHDSKRIPAEEVSGQLVSSKTKIKSRVKANLLAIELSDLRQGKDLGCRHSPHHIHTPKVVFHIQAPAPASLDKALIPTLLSLSLLHICRLASWKCFLT